MLGAVLRPSCLYTTFASTLTLPCCLLGSGSKALCCLATAVCLSTMWCPSSCQAVLRPLPCRHIKTHEALSDMWLSAGSHSAYMCAIAPSMCLLLIGHVVFVGNTIGTVSSVYKQTSHHSCLLSMSQNSVCFDIGHSRNTGYPAHSSPGCQTVQCRQVSYSFLRKQNLGDHHHSWLRRGVAVTPREALSSARCILWAVDSTISVCQF